MVKKSQKIVKKSSENIDVVIRELFERKFSGKCSGCDFRFSCGGCRARAEGKFGDYLAEDPDCWL